MQIRRAERRWAAALVATGVALGCGTEADNGMPRDGSGDATNPDWPYTTPLSMFRQCPGPLGSPDDLAATPRADENLEFLALSVEPDAVVASQANYERVVADVAAIRALVPDLASIEYRPPHDAGNVQLSLDDAGLTAWGMGAFAGLECLNEALGATLTGVMDNWDLYSPRLVLRGIHAMPRVEQLYEELPGVSAEIFEGLAHGSTWCIGRHEADYEYVIDRAAGDCSAECPEHEAHRFGTRAAGEATTLEIWRSADGEPPPDWYTRLCP